jgi:hypothetical protein
MPLVFEMSSVATHALERTAIGLPSHLTASKADLGWSRAQSEDPACRRDVRASGDLERFAVGGAVKQFTEVRVSASNAAIDSMRLMSKLVDD